jgi:hypothetical protein
MVAIDGMMVARSTNFGREAYRVLWYLTAQLDFTSFTVVELHIAIHQARQIVPNPKNPATLAITWAANLAGPELARITELATLYKAAFRKALAIEFKSRDPGAFAAWDRANQRTIERDRGPSLGR